MSKKYLSSELASEMEKVLIKKANNVDDSNLENAVNYLNSAIDILEDAGLSSKANNISDEPVSEIDTMITEASRKRPRNPEKVSDRHTKNLNPKRMVKNLKGHGTVFNMADISYSNDDLLDLDIDVEDPDFTSSDSDLTFED